MKLLWRIIIGYLGIILSLNYSAIYLVATAEEFNPTNILIGILFNIIFVFDLINASKYNDLSKNIMLNMTPIMVLFVIISNFGLWEFSYWYKPMGTIILISILSIFSLVLIANRLFNYFKSKKA